MHRNITIAAMNPKGSTHSYITRKLSRGSGGPSVCLLTDTQKRKYKWKTQIQPKLFLYLLGLTQDFWRRAFKMSEHNQQPFQKQFLSLKNSKFEVIALTLITNSAMRASMKSDPRITGPIASSHLSNQQINFQ